MSELIVKTYKFDKNAEICADIHIKDPTIASEDFSYNLTSIIIIKNKHIQIDWCDYRIRENYSIQYLYFVENDLLFIGAEYFWVVLKIDTSEIIQIEKCLSFWSFTKFSNSVMVITELKAMSINFKGEKIAEVPIDPPFEYKRKNNRIIFNSNVFGKQILKLC